MKSKLAVPNSGTICAAILALAIAAPSLARAQSADLVLCDRIAADPADPDKPADMRGVSEIAQQDIATAIRYCRNASNTSRRAMYSLGRAYAANRQPAEAMAAYRRAADKGSTSAMVELGIAYATANGVNKDETQARTLFERAANGGNPRGVTNLAALSPGGTPSDPARARELLQRGAETNAEAQYQLGMMLSEGIGGPKDDVTARSMFERAAAQNHAEAMERMGAFLRQGRGGPKDSTASKSWYERAAALGNEDAKAALKDSDCSIMFRDKSGKNIGCF